MEIIRLIVFILLIISIIVAMIWYREDKKDKRRLIALLSSITLTLTFGINEYRIYSKGARQKDCLEIKAQIQQKIIGLKSRVDNLSSEKKSDRDFAVLYDKAHDYDEKSCEYLLENKTIIVNLLKELEK